MSLAEASTVERFAHELASPGFGDLRDDVAARSQRISALVDEVIAKLGPEPGQSVQDQSRHLALVEGLTALMSSGLDVLRGNLDAMDPDGPLFEAAEAAHNAMVEDYYRLVALSAALDPGSRAGPVAEPLADDEDVGAWMERQIAALHADA
jgi:hypothetical protein